MTTCTSDANLTSADMNVTAQPNTWDFSCPQNGGYQIFPVSNATTRDQARILLQQVYRERGYAYYNDEFNQISKASTERPELTLLAIHANGEHAGTVSLSLDSPKGLPCDEIFGKELSTLRAQGRNLTEVTGLALSARHMGSKVLLVHLMNFILITARRICHSSTVLIEVNPRHEKFYRRLLKFKEAGPVRPCRRVHGAPARLLSLDMTLQREAIRTEAGWRNGNSRTLYKYFHTLEEECAIMQFLNNSTIWESTVRTTQDWKKHEVNDQ